MRVLGTPVWSLEVGEEEEILCVSDLHLTPEHEEVSLAFFNLCRSRPENGILIVLGDLFDAWVGPRQRKARGWRELCGLLARGWRGRRVYLLHGNRDYLLESRFAEATGSVVVPGGLLLRRPGGRTLLCLHGDELCTRDHAYQRAKRRLRSAPMRKLVSGLPWFLTRRLAARARAKSRTVVRAADPATLLPPPEALAAAAELHDGPLLFGHIHRLARGPLREEGSPSPEYFVLPAFEPPSFGHALWAGDLPVHLEAGARSPWGSPLV